MSSHHICWGKVLTGAAVAAGAVAVIAFMPEEALSAASTAIHSGAAAIGDVGSWIINQVGNLAHFIVDNPALSISTAGVAGGLLGMRHDKRTVETHALREDMRRTEELMRARMQAKGYELALAEGKGL